MKTYFSFLFGERGATHNFSAVVFYQMLAFYVENLVQNVNLREMPCIAQDPSFCKHVVCIR